MVGVRMNRRRFFVSSGAVGIAASAGCLGREVCEKPSNHLYVENHHSEKQTVDVQVYRLRERLVRDAGWEQTFSEAIDVPGESHVSREEIYDTHGTYRTEAEHGGRLEQNRSEVDDCEDRAVTIGIGDGIHSIMTGRPDEFLPEAESDATGSR